MSTTNEELLEMISKLKEEIVNLKDDLALVVLEGAEEIGRELNSFLNELRGTDKNYIIPIKQTRFANGEAKVEILETVRGKQIFIIGDIGNWSVTYDMNGITNHKSPDDHVIDVIRVVDAAIGNAKEVNVVLPLFPYSRQHRRDCRVSTDGAMVFSMFKNAGVSKFITIDMHSAEISGVIHDREFDNLFPTHTILKDIIENEKISYNNTNGLLVIAPDVGAARRARYTASMLNCNLGIFNKRRDRTKIVDGKNPIVAHDYIGEDVVGKTVIIVDDMIATGGSILEVARDMRERGATNIILMATFSMFSKGLDAFDKAYEDGEFDRVYTTNMTYFPEEVNNREWIKVVNCSEFLAKVINNINQNRPISDLMNGKEEIVELLGGRVKILNKEQ